MKKAALRTAGTAALGVAFAAAAAGPASAVPAPLGAGASAPAGTLAEADQTSAPATGTVSRVMGMLNPAVGAQTLSQLPAGTALARLAAKAGRLTGQQEQRSLPPTSDEQGQDTAEPAGQAPRSNPLTSLLGSQSTPLSGVLGKSGLNGVTGNLGSLGGLPGLGSGQNLPGLGSLGSLSSVPGVGGVSAPGLGV